MTAHEDSRPAAAVEGKTTKAAWLGLALLVVSVAINYIDRTNLSVAAPELRTELGLSPAQLGLLLSAFFWTYASFQIVSGWLVDRYDVNWVFGAGFLIWSGATAATGFVGGFGVLFSLRLVLGAAESVAYPSYSKIIATRFPEHRRGLTNALIDAGSKIGPALGTLIGGLVVARFGWRDLFLVLGFGALLWVPLWAGWSLRTTGVGKRQRHEGPGFGRILRERSAWGTFFGLFCINYAWYFLITWLPAYLVMERHLSMRMMALMGSVPLWGLAASATINGWLSDHLIRRGATPTLVRKGFVAAGLLLCTLVLPAAIVPSLWMCITLLTAACLSFGLCTSNHWAITQTIAGAPAAGKWTGLQNGFGNLAGVAAPWITGVIVSATGHFLYAFVAVCVVLVLGALSYLFVVGPVSTVDWAPPGEGLSKHHPAS
jgi:MFS transporter, ACS family, D-galactonate transporter